MSLMECTPFMYSQSHLFSTFVLITTPSVWPWSDIPSSSPVVLCYVLRLFTQHSHYSTHGPLLFYLQGSIKDAHFIWYHHLWFPPHCGITASHMILFTLTLFHISCILSVKVTVLFTIPSSGFADRENGAGDHIRFGHGLRKMIVRACVWLHLQNPICI